MASNLLGFKYSNTWHRDLDADSKQMGQNGGSWRDSPGTDKPGGSWLTVGEMGQQTKNKRTYLI
ncbi:hypothetical protein DPMN_082301 [Dreissena polymorpha]|uniref:Uncharacterized protein n=1 Tax=Dreissena polymorpha TaxID=45954 RepID=A0A9D3YAL6_DREPO|nr:hypothetical protein DPMN_082301 [Dreissena polymorpha]